MPVSLSPNTGAVIIIGIILFLVIGGFALWYYSKQTSTTTIAPSAPNVSVPVYASVPPYASVPSYASVPPYASLSEFMNNFPISMISTASKSYGYGTYGSGFAKFTVNGDSITIVTDNDPFPIPAGSGSTLSNTYNRSSPTVDPRAGYGGGGLIGQDQNWTFTVSTYYGGKPLASLPTAGEGTSMYALGCDGITSKGIVLNTPYAASLVQYPYMKLCTGKTYPNYNYVDTSPLIINPVYCATRYLVDFGGGHPTGPNPGRTDNYQYHYHDGMFLYMFMLSPPINNIPQAPMLTQNSVMQGPLVYPLVSPYPNFTPNYNVNTLSNYYKNTYFTDPKDGSIDFFRHPDGHSKIIGISLDGYPIYGPYGYNTNVTTSNYTFNSFTATVNSNVVVVQSSYMEFNTHSFYGPFFSNPSTVYSVASSSSTSSSTSSTGQSTQTGGGGPPGGGSKIYTSYIPTTTGGYYAVTNNQITAPTTTLSSLPSGTTTRMALSIQQITDADTTNPQKGPTGCYDLTSQYTMYPSKSSSTTFYYVEPDGITMKQTSSTTYSIAASPMGSIAQDYFYDWNLPLQNTATPSAPFFLDQYNGKYGPTPDYPTGTYAYYLTFTYPYIFSPTTRNAVSSSSQVSPQTTTTYLS